MSQTFKRRELLVRRVLFWALTPLMLLTAFSRPSDGLGWWSTGLEAPKVSVHPSVLGSQDRTLKVTIESQEELEALEVSLDGGKHWVPSHYVPAFRNLSKGDEGYISLSLPIHTGFFESLLSYRVGSKAPRKMVSLLLRGINQEGIKTPPRSLVVLYE